MNTDALGIGEQEDMMEEKMLANNHKLLASNRTTASLSGVLDVISFDLKEILLETEQGMLTIRGSNLHINRLSVEKGDVEIEGKIDAFLYSDLAHGKNSGESLLGRLFK